jgi:hypothetical protein
MIKPTITQVHRVTSQTYCVLLSCGHCHTVSSSEFDHEQWFIGKAVD